MTVEYFSLNAGAIATITVPQDLVDELQVVYSANKSQFDKMGIKTFEDYVRTVLSFNV